MKANEEGIVVTGTWVHEGHTVTFMILEDDTIKVSESIHRGVGSNWSTSKEVSFVEAMKEQEQLIKFGYTKMT